MPCLTQQARRQRDRDVLLFCAPYFFHQISVTRILWRYLGRII
jgi:hypothetical protein